MTTTVTQTTQAAITGNPMDSLSTALGIITIALLMLLLVQKELFRAQDGPRWSRVALAMDSAAVPLLLAAGCMISLRVLDIVNVF
ncbi:hypothetical protein BH24CHL1_BH24CHL1_12670 [soil metagenome]